MTPEQIISFKEQVTAAIEQHLAKGGAVVRGYFGMGNKYCPISCLLDQIGRGNKEDVRISQQVSDKLGFLVPEQDMWAFVCAFDFGDAHNYDNREMEKVGQELRAKYITSPKEQIK